MSGNERVCGVCKWWGDPIVGCHARCNHAKCGDYEGELLDGAGDAEFSAIYTGPDFGCVHWEAK
jgi:hypothetical protein